MTGGSIGSPTYHQPRYARLPYDANQALVNDTFYLNDVAFVLPDRSHVRRRAFQNLQNRYYRQILYGCTNPHCKTSTCLSRQKRLSRGPFRPYTVLSARALATFLASEDHPEDGLCPHQPVNLQAVSAPGPSRKNTKLAQKVKGPPGSPQRAPVLTPFSYGLPSVIEPSIPISSTTQAATGHVSSASPEPRPSRSDAIVKSDQEPRLDDHTHKDKDLRSFAQCLFDTVAMKCLQLAGVPDGFFSWMRPTPQERHDGNHDKDVEQDPTSKNEQSSQDIQRQSSVTPQVPPSLGEEIEEAVDVSPPEQTAVVLDPVVSLPNVSHDARTRTSSPTTESDHAQNEDCPKRKRHDQAGRPCAYLERSEQRGAGQSKDDNSAAEVMIAESHLQHATSNTVQMNDNGNTHIGYPRPQSLSHFTADNIQALKDGIVRRHSGLFEGHRRCRLRGRTDAPPWSSTFPHGEIESYRNFLSYSAQSMTYILSNPEALMQSFVHCENDDNASKKTLRSYPLPLMVHSFRQLRGIDFHPASILPSLWVSVGYIYPDRSSGRTNPIARTKSSPLRYDVEACHIAKIIFAGLISWVPDCHARTWTALSKLRAAGRVAPSADGSIVDQKAVRSVLNAGAAFENEMALSIATRLVRAIAARHFDIIHTSTGEYSLYYTAYIVRYLISESFKVLVADNEAPFPSVKGGEVDMKDRFQVSEGLERPFKVIIEWLRSVIMREWDGKPQIWRSSAVGSALELLYYIKIHCFWFDDEPEIFYTPFLSEPLNVMEMPLEWIESTPDKNMVHLLSYPFLFPPSVLVSYFRAINYADMYKAFEQAAMAEHLVRRMSFTDAQTGRGAIRLRDRLRIAQSNYLVLEIRRKEVLTDAMDQLWRRQKRELMRPLQVRMGLAEGEEGVDHGGVQQEFFRVAVAEAMNPKYGAFTTDQTTQMSWFQPGSLEPLYKFELLGLLTSLAVYNGLTLPFTFPVALYRKLLDMPVGRLEDIKDGWPELTKGLQILRDWPEDNVEEVFMRPYVFSVNVFGTNVDVDMEKAKKTYFRRVEKMKRWRERNGKDHRAGQRSNGAGSRSDESEESSTSRGERHSVTKDGKAAKEVARPTNAKRDTNSSRPDYSSDEDEAFHGYRSFTHSILPRTKPHDPNSEPIMVNNANREEYIHDYIVHLVHFTVEPQWHAFRAGFFTCINPKLLKLFGPSTLKALVEGLPNIDVEGLEHVTTYEGGYHKGHPTVRQLWRVVRSWPQEKVRQLLEFVTSSDRLPVGGVERLVFVVQKNGVGDGRLPSSSTCFGRLLLPEYTSEDKLRQGLDTAVQNAKGFGQP